MNPSKDRHVYDYHVTPGAVGDIVPNMVGNGVKVLELGTGPGAITKQLHAKGCKVTGLEIDATAIPLVEPPYCERVIQADLNNPDWAALLVSERFDVIVMTDVLEHLYDPWRTLEAASGLLVPNGAVIVSLPHIGHSAVLASLLNGRFDYQRWGLLDRTHIRFFGLCNVPELFSGAGLKIVDAGFVVKLPEQTEFATHWKHLPDAAQQVLAENPHGNVYQVVAKAVRAEAPGNAIDLLQAALPAPAPGNYGGNRVTRFIAGFISWENRQRIAGVLRRMGFRI
jgi:SAM-dependent methyltransferase